MNTQKFSSNIFSFIEQGIMVASFEMPEEFERRKTKISQSLFKVKVGPSKLDATNKQSLNHEKNRVGMINKPKDFKKITCDQLANTTRVADQDKGFSEEQKSRKRPLNEDDNHYQKRSRRRLIKSTDKLDHHPMVQKLDKEDMPNKKDNSQDLLAPKNYLPSDNNIFSFIEQAIMVVSWEMPEEFERRKTKIATSLFKVTDHEINKKVTTTTDANKQALNHEKKRVDMINMPKDFEKPTCDQLVNTTKLDKIHLDSAVRRMKSKYQHIQDSRKKIQLLDPKELPPLPVSVPPCNNRRFYKHKFC